MKSVLGAALLSLLVTNCAGQAAFVRIPAPGATLIAGQNFTLQLVKPNSIEGSTEVGLAIGLFNCPTSPCPAPDAEMGDILYAGPFNPQLHELPGEAYQNFTLTIPSIAEGGTTGAASLQLAKLRLIGAGPSPLLEFTNVSVTIEAVPTAPFTIHPQLNSSKCVGILGGAYTTGAQVDIYDCNGSNTQKWLWNDQALVSVNPADQSQWCVDAGNPSQLADGVKMAIAPCVAGLSQQTWDVPAPSSDPEPIALSIGDWCLDLTGGNTTNRNVIQVWTCVGNNNQRWTFTNV